ncbi:MAG: ABC transporter ATP-binding protein [Verrucomicrobiota bacterium]
MQVSEQASDMPPGGARLRVEGLSKQFDRGEPVLSEISLAAEPGEVLALLGPSGCGKTTLLRLLAGLIESNAGQIAIDGTPPAQAREALSFVFQDPTLLPWLDTRRNVELPLRLRGRPREERREVSERLLRWVGLSEAAGRYPAQLSGGMRMRAAVARALSLAPRLLLMDEPFGAVDEITRNRLNEDLLALHARQGMTLLFVTHSVPEAVFLASRIYILSPAPGRLQQIVEVPFAYPREAALRESPDYLQKVRETSAALRHCLL